MKKLLALLLVLGMASMAQAGVILSVDGQPAANEYTFESGLVPSGTLKLDVMLEAGMVINGGDLQVRVTGPGSLNSSGITFPSLTLRYWQDTELEDPYYIFHGWKNGVKVLGAPYAKAYSDPTSVIVTGGDLQWNTAGITTGSPAPKFTVLDNLFFHCEGQGEVKIELIAPSGLSKLLYGPDPTGPPGEPWPLPWLLPEVIGVQSVAGAGAILDTIIVHQIPEPMTMSLLGLGGLALLRRRHA